MLSLPICSWAMRIRLDVLTFVKVEPAPGKEVLEKLIGEDGVLEASLVTL